VAADEIFLGRVGARGAGPTATPTPSGPTTSIPPVPRALYRSRGDLAPQLMTVSTPAASADAGFVFTTPSYNFKSDGPAIYDDRGSPVWLHPLTGKASAEDFRVSLFQGTPVLTWWEGTVTVGLGTGQYVMADSTYREIGRFGAANGLAGDLHEFLITAKDTALVTAGREVPLATPLTASPSGAAPTIVSTVWEGIVQEIDIVTQKVVFEWHSLDHIDPAESYEPLPTTPGQAYDYLHLNSIDVDADGNLLISARHTFGVYKIDRATGEVIWRLGGKKSDFTMGPGTNFAWQHDARRQADGTITLFDDNQAPNGSRGLVLEVDTTAKAASLVRAYTHPPAIQATSQGNVQVLPNGDAFIGWGSQPNVSEFDTKGQLVFDAALPPGGSSYRAFRFPWVGRPTELPAIALDLSEPGTLTAFVSWNGATEVASWELLGGGTPATLTPLASAPRDGFETALAIPRRPAFVAARAHNFTGLVLGTSPVITTTL
ncbi:MAG TPA: arylsulfotransferase family protein, partial [Candidatus Sulfotelmatobacter sp.]|nr:arylsulfotransferase family protein [Candidatus Sulfotelmatobacter sp.]